MAEIPSQLSFSALISHTFPGVFVTIGIFLMLYTQFSASIDNLFSLLQGKDNSWASFIGAVGSLIFFGTIIGIVVDAVSHVIIELLYYHFCQDNQFKAQTKTELNLKSIKNILIEFLMGILKGTVILATLPFYWWVRSKCREIESREKDIFKDKSGERASWFYYIGRLDINKFKYIDENYYCYQECMFNLSFSFLFSAITYSIFFVLYMHDTKLAFISVVSFIILFYICFNLGLYFFIRLRLNRVEFIKGAMGY